MLMGSPASTPPRLDAAKGAAPIEPGKAAGRLWAAWFRFMAAQARLGAWNLMTVGIPLATFLPNLPRKRTEDAWLKGYMMYCASGSLVLLIASLFFEQAAVMVEITLDGPPLDFSI